MLNVLVFPYAHRTVVLGLRRKDVSNDQGPLVGRETTQRVQDMERGNEGAWRGGSRRQMR